jgi:hypothetical protein
MVLKPVIIDEADELEAFDLVGDGGGKRGGGGNEKPSCDCERPMGLVLPAGFAAGAERIFKCACSKLIGFVGDGLSGTERTDAA